MPKLELPPVNPFTSQATLEPAARQNEAPNDCGWPSATFAAAGEIAFVAVHVIVTLAPPDADVSATLVAVTVTVAGDGTDEGAV